MRRKLFFIGVIFSLLIVAAVTPFSVRAEGDPPPNPEPVKPPWITGINPDPALSTEEQEELTAAGIADLAAGVEVPLLAPAPDYVDLIPQESADPSIDNDPLAVPQLYQDPSDATCGAAALGMALEFLSLNGEGQAPSQAALISDLKNSGLLYETGTGMEELAFLARQHGYQGTSAFHEWTFTQLKDQLGTGTPVVVSLGSNGANQPGHFVTLTGISADGEWVSYNDPILGKQTVLSETFQTLWDLQGNSVLVAQKEPLPAVDNPMLPWMGLFSAMAVLAVMAKNYPLGNEVTSILENIRNLLSNPQRKGLAGKLISGGGSSSAPPSYKWVEKKVPVYGWKNAKITLSRQVPILKRTKIKAGTRVYYEKVPRYRTVRVDAGRWATHKVTKYRNKKYVRYYRTTRVRKTRWVRRGWRFVKQTYYVAKRTPVYGTRKVPYTTAERYWKSKWVTKQVPDGYRSIRKEEPVYEYRMLPTGRTRTEIYTDIERRWMQIGTDVKRELVKLPDPPKIDWKKKEEFLTGSGKGLKSEIVPEEEEPTPTPPYQTLTTTPDQATSTATPLYPTQGSSPIATVEPTPTPYAPTPITTEEIQSTPATTQPPTSSPTSTPSATIDSEILAKWVEEQEPEKNLFDYTRQVCDWIDPGQLDATSGTAIDTEVLLNQATLYCTYGMIAALQPELLPLCGTIPIAAYSCHIYDLVFDLVEQDGYYYENLFKNILPEQPAFSPIDLQQGTPTPYQPTPTETPVTPTPTQIPTTTGTADEE